MNRSLFNSHSHAHSQLQGSPDSPSFLPRKSIKRYSSTNNRKVLPLATKNLNTIHSYSYDSPTSTLAADLSVNFHIDSKRQNSNPTPKRSLNFDENDDSNSYFNSTKTMSLEESFTLDEEEDPEATFTMRETKAETNEYYYDEDDEQDQSEDLLDDDESPLLNRSDQLPPKIPQRSTTFLDEQTARSSRTTSNASISSIASITSISSVESSSSTATTTTTTAPGFLKPKRTLRRAKTSIASNIRLLHSYSASSIDVTNSKLNMHNEFSKGFDVDEDSDDALDKFCVPSPIPERSFILDQEEQEDDYPGHLGLNKREIGSPIQRKPVRSKVRRIHSMFYSKKEITDTTNMFGNLMNSPGGKLMDQDDDSALSNSLLKKSKIETFTVKNDSIPRIHVQTLCKILDNHYKEFFDEVIIVDCRFEYEYKGGHINGSVNVSSQSELEEKFLHNRPQLGVFQQKKRTLIVFHCEFSSYRGPLMASHLRTCDRNINQDNYPHLDYPDILILEGGYQKFFDSESQRCYPQKYVEMNDNNHKNVCEKELTRFKRDLKRASSFNSLSFAASMNSSTTITSSNHRLHRRTVTSGNINFVRKSSKSQLLDFSKSSTELPLSKHSSLKEDENKPPESLNFGFKFPLGPNKIDHSPSTKLKKKLSRSLTTSFI